MVAIFSPSVGDIWLKEGFGPSGEIFREENRGVAKAPSPNPGAGGDIDSIAGRRQIVWDRW